MRSGERMRNRIRQIGAGAALLALALSGASAPAQSGPQVSNTPQAGGFTLKVENDLVLTNVVARDAKTGEPLIINLDTTLTGVGAKSQVDWLQKQFSRIDVQLVVRSTDFNRFQDKVMKGNAQLFYFGWNADYPDPENFLFLLNGRQGKVKFQGENAANYQNPEYDRLFDQVKAMDNGPARQALIDRMVTILREDAPWAWGFHPVDYTLAHQWLFNRKPSKVARNTLKYQRLDPVLREQLRGEWNRPVLWPALILLGALLALSLAVYRAIWRRELARARPC